MKQSLKIALKTGAMFFLLFCFGWQPVLALTRPNDPDYFLQWQFDKINLPQAWDNTQGSPAVTIAVLDTGVDINHPDLVANIWTNTKEIPNNGIDDDHNGYIDDVHGWDFIDHDNDPRPDYSTGYSPEALGHGTMVAGIVGAVGNNLRGISGIAWYSKIMPIRVLDNYGFASIEPTIKGIDYAIASGAQVINLSFQGQTAAPEFQAALERAYRAGVVVVGAAGNGGYDLETTPFYPACYNTSDDQKMVIGVGSVDQNDQLSTFSNYGRRCVDVMAPGEAMYSTQVYAGPDIPGLDTYYSGGWRGTSLAAPIVSGVAALIKSINKNFSPALILKFIRDSADPIDSLNPNYIGKLGAGRINAAKAIAAAVAYQKDHGGEVNNPRAYFSFLSNGLVLAAATGQKPQITILDPEQQIVNQFLAYDKNFHGGVSVAVGDIDLDGVDEIVTAPGVGGGPQVKIWRQDGSVISQFLAYDKNFHGGVDVAVGDVNGDGLPEIITAPQSGGGPQVKIFDRYGILKGQFLAYDKNFYGGVSLAVGDVNSDGFPEIITAPGKSGGPQVKVFNNKGKMLSQFMAYDKNFRGGVNLAVGDVNNDYQPEIVTAPQGSGGPHVRIFDWTGVVKSQFMAFDPKYTGGVTVAAGDDDGDGIVDIVAASKLNPAKVVVFTNTGQLKNYFTSSYTKGLNLGIIN